MTLLLTLLLKSLLLFAVSGLLLFALRRSSAAARSLVCLLTLGATLALPLCSAVLPGWQVLPSPALSSQPVGAPLAVPSSPSMPSPSGTPATSPLASRVSSSGKESAEGAANSAPTPVISAPPLLGAGGPLLLFFLLGLLLASVRPLLGLWGIHRLSRECITVTDPQTLTLAADCAHLLGLKMPPRLCVAAAVPVPMTWGWRRPVVVLPPLSAEWPEDRLRSVLLHEMAHIKRRDWPAHRFADVACAVYWFHPLVWLTARRLRVETELACDDLVLSSGIPASDYARHLLEIASALPRVSGRSHTAIAMAQTSKIESRLQMILDKTRPRRPLARRVLVFALIPAAAALITLAVLRPDAKAQTFSGTEDTQTVGNLSVQLAGITDGNLPGNQWWSAAGAVLSSPVYDPSAPGTRGYILPRTYHKYRNLIFAFRLPPTAKGVTTQWELPGSRDASSEGTWITKMAGGDDTLPEAKISGKSGGTRTVLADYPFSVSHADVKVRIASGPWTTVATQNVRNDWFGTTKSGAAGTFIFSTVTKAQYERPAVTITTDQIKQDVRVVAVDIQGHETLPVGAGDQSTGNLKQMTVDFDEDPAKRIVEFRVQTRPFQQAEFKNIPLQPILSVQPAAPATYQKTFASGITLSIDALTRLSAAGGEWWHPDGTPLSGPVAGREEQAALKSWSPEQHPRALLFTAAAPRDLSYSEAVQFLIDGKPIAPLNSLDFAQRIQKGRPSPSSRYQDFPAGAASCSLRYGIAAGPWTTAAVRKVHFTPTSLQNRGGDADKDYNGDVSLEISKQSILVYNDVDGVLRQQAFTAQPLGEVARQIVAVDASGNQTPLVVTGSTGRDMSIISLAFSDHSVLHDYNPKINLAEIRELRLQTRPYEWVQFDNIALQPAK